jgi:hypothetical protein
VARRLRDAGDRGKGAKPPQAVLVFDTAALTAAAGREILLCAFNNGLLDRSAAGKGRQFRRRGDHRPFDGWRTVGRRPADRDWAGIAAEYQL